MIATDPGVTLLVTAVAQSWGRASTETTMARSVSSPGRSRPVAGSVIRVDPIDGRVRPSSEIRARASSAAACRPGWWKGTELASGSQANRKGVPPSCPAARFFASAWASPSRPTRSRDSASGSPERMCLVGPLTTPMAIRSCAPEPARMAARRPVRGPEMATMGVPAVSAPANAAATAESDTAHGCRAAQAPMTAAMRAASAAMRTGTRPSRPRAVATAAARSPAL